MPNIQHFLIATASLFLSAVPGSVAAIVYGISFDDPAGTYSSHYSAITSNIQAAGAQWGNSLADSGSLEVRVSFSGSAPTANGSSVTSGFVGIDGGRNVYEQGAAHELRTGVDPNGIAPDISFIIGTSYLSDTLWFDPTPFNRSDETIPPNRVDAVSVFMHEFGHAFAFNGWRNYSDQTLPPSYQSTFDQQTLVIGSHVYFTGPRAQALYGGPVPLTLGNHNHFGNSSGPGTDLVSDLMNGVVFDYRTRYAISSLDLAVFADIGIRIIPEPSGSSLAAFGLMLRIATGRRRSKTPRRLPNEALHCGFRLALIQFSRRTRRLGRMPCRKIPNHMQAVGD